MLARGSVGTYVSRCADLDGRARPSTARPAAGGVCDYIAAVPAITLPDPPISDGVVSLRAWAPTDVAWIVAACQDPAIPRWTFVPSPYTDDDARAHVAGAGERLASGRTAELAVVDARTGERLGASGLVVIDWHHKAGDVGYWVAASARGRGVATRALVLVSGWAFDSLGLERLELRPRRQNIASCAVARRAGFTPDATPVISRPECDALPDTLLYVRHRQDWLALHPSAT
jgi:RimJ/RimL family protein N-acetyltransferase